VVSGTGAGLTSSYADTSVPEVQWAGLHNGRIIVVGPAGRGIRFSAWTTQYCSGVAQTAISIAVNGGSSTSVGPTSAVFDDAFGATWLSAVRTAMPSRAGRYVATATTQRRYDSFVLDADHRLVSKVDSVDAPVSVGGPWTAVPQYVLRQSTLTARLSRSLVGRGGAVTVTGHLNYALDRAWARDTGGRVTVLTRAPGKPWVARTILLADANGRISWTFRPVGRTYIHLVHEPTYSGRFTAGSSTAALLVTVR
jgi:hypothetical protein